MIGNTTSAPDAAGSCGGANTTDGAADAVAEGSGSGEGLAVSAALGALVGTGVGVGASVGSAVTLNDQVSRSSSPSSDEMVVHWTS